MAESVDENLPTALVPHEIFPNLFPSELFKFIFDHSDVISLMHLSATSQVLRQQVHDFFKSRLSDEAAAYPEVREGLARIGWTKDHKLWTCNCFKPIAGPGFTWRRLNERTQFSVVCSSRTSLIKMSTTAAGKTFVIASAMDLVYWATPSYSAMGQNSPRSLVSYKNSQISIGCLSSYAHVLAFSLSKPFSFHRSIAISIYNPRTLRRITDIEVMAHGGIVSQKNVKGIVFSQDTMVVLLECATDTEDYTEFEIWKMNTKEPEEEGIALVNTISHRNSPLPRYLNDSLFLPHELFCVNDRFIVIRDDNADELKVFQRNEEAVLIGQLGLGGERLRGIALEKGPGDLIALVFKCYSEDYNPKLVVQVYSASRGDLIIRKESLCPNVRYMQWFGHHLVLVLEQDKALTMMSWQQGLADFLTCPLSVPVMRSCMCPTCGIGCTSSWCAYCLHVDFRGITSAIQMSGYKEWNVGSEVAYFQTWDSY